ncbi:MAG: acyl-CoA reductase, partial [Myxococcota bacterium]
TSVLAGGSIPMPTLLSGVLPLVLGSPVLLRETSQDPVTGSLLARSIADRDESLARCLEVVRFPVEDASAMEVFLESPCVVATGSDQTIAALRSHLAPGQRFVAYGHRFSIGVLGPNAARDEANLDRTAAGLALDLARWDQAGCLSPVVVYLVGLAAPMRVQIAKRIADSLESLSLSRPRGDVSASTLASHAAERAEARMRAAVDEEASLFEGSDFAVVLEADARPRPAPLARFLRLLPVSSLEELDRALSPFSAHLSNAAVAGFDSIELATLHEQLTQLGVNRITKPGFLQTPPIDWPHDGMPLFLPMARFAQRDRP